MFIKHSPRQAAGSVLPVTAVLRSTVKIKFQDIEMLYEFDGKKPVVGKSSYVSDIARVIGDVVIGENCYIGHGAILRGDYGRTLPAACRGESLINNQPVHQFKTLSRNDSNGSRQPHLPTAIPIIQIQGYCSRQGAKLSGKIALVRISMDELPD